MHPELEKYARFYLLYWLRKLTPTQRRCFKLMYGRDGGRRSVDTTYAMDIEDVVNEVPVGNLDTAMCQVDASLKELRKKEADELEPWSDKRPQGFTD